MKGINRNNINEHLIEKMFNIIEKTTIDALFTKEWHNEWKLNKIQYERFKRYSLPVIRGVLKCSKSNAEKAFSDFYETYGLRIKNINIIVVNS